MTEEPVICWRYPMACLDPWLCERDHCIAPRAPTTEEQRAAMRDWNAYCAKLKRELDRR